MEKDFFDFIVLGAGPAGLAAAQYGARADLSTLVIDNGIQGGQALLINELENYPGIYPAITGEVFVDNMVKQATSFGAEFLRTEVRSIDKIHNKFHIKTDNGEFKAYAVLIATGAIRRKLGIPGEDTFAGRGVSYCATCDGPFFRNKKIVLVGGGDTACTEASYLSTISNDITVIHRKGSFRAQKALADRVLNNKNIKVLFNTEVKEVQGSNKVESLQIFNNKTNKTHEISADALFIFVGMKPQTALVETLPKDQLGHIEASEEMETSIPGMFVAGDIRSKPFRQIVTATADGTIAALKAGEYVRDLHNEVYH